MSRVAVDYKTPTSTAKSRHVRWFALGLLSPLLVGAGLYWFATRPQPASTPLLPDPQFAIAIEQPALDVTTLASSPPRAFGVTVEYVVRRNDTLDRIFRQLNISLDDLSAIRALPETRARLDRLAPGDAITLVHEDDLLLSLQRRVSESELLRIDRGENGFSAHVVTTPIEIREATAHGEIRSSLFVSARSAGVSPELILQLANDIFGWEIDFALDIQPGDTFNIVYEQKFREGEYIGDGRILTAEFINNDVVHRAVYYKSADGRIADYFAPDGRSMRRQFLRAPLDFTRISSNFNPRRRHPIMNSIRAHRGVDYAAPTGTVIKAAGEGRIAFIGTKGGYGRVVILEHGGGVSTLYGHMSRFASGLRAGTRVRQGQTIGYVGMSGAATGPHLHYEYRVNGVHKNPRTVPLPNAAPIAPSYVAEFHQQSAVMLARLDKSRDSAVVAKPAP